MTPEQRAKLEANRVALLTVLGEEADPGRFPGMATREERGDRQWHKTNAIKTATLIMRLEELLGLRGHGAGTGRPPSDDDDETTTKGASAGPSETDALIRAAGNKVAQIRKGGGRGKKG